MDWEPAGRKKAGVSTPKGKKRSGCLVAVAVVIVVAIVGGISRCGGGADKGDTQRDWPATGLAALLPDPGAGSYEVHSNDDETLWVDVNEYSSSDYDSYIAACQERGFTVDQTKDSLGYEAYSEDGNHLSLTYFKSSEEMGVRLEAAVEMGAISWPKGGAGSLVPAPTSTKGKIDSDSSSFFFAYVGETDQAAFSAYVDECSAAGFNVDYDRGDTWYGGKNAEGVSLRVEYRGFNTMTVRVEVPDDSPEPTSPEAEAPVAEPEAAEPTAGTGNETGNAPTGGSSDFRSTMDAYESFMNEYCDFMESYGSNPGNAVSMAADYASMMSRYSDFMSQVDAIDENSLSADDLAYYNEVMARVNTRLLEIGQ